MTRRTPVQQWQLDRLADLEDLRAFTQEVACSYPGCGVPVGSPCVYVTGTWRGKPLSRMDHQCRRAAARALAQTVPCGTCLVGVGEPCVYPTGSPWAGQLLGLMDHQGRITAARAREETSR